MDYVSSFLWLIHLHWSSRAISYPEGIMPIDVVLSRFFFLLRYCVKISDNKWWNNWLCWGYPVKMALKNTSEKLNSNVSLQISWPGDSRQSSSYFFLPSDAHQPTSPHRRKPASSHRQETHAKDINNSGILLSCALRLARLISLMS